MWQKNAVQNFRDKFKSKLHIVDCLQRVNSPFTDEEFNINSFISISNANGPLNTREDYVKWMLVTQNQA